MLLVVLLWSFGINGALLQGVNAVADCEWYPDVNACIPVLNEASAVGDQYTQLTLELIVCLENNSEDLTGCRRENPAYRRLCANVPVPDGGADKSMCLPASANLTSLSLSQARDMKAYFVCIGLATAECAQIRGGLYNFLGCAECGDVANSAALVEGACTGVFGDGGSAAACAAAGTAAPTADGRVVANMTAIDISGPAPPLQSGVDVPLLGGPPTVRAASSSTPAAAAPAPAAPAPANPRADEPDADASGGAVPEPSSQQAAPRYNGAVHQSAAARLCATAAAGAAAVAAVAAACVLRA